MEADQQRHILEEVSRAGIQLLLREPFFAHVLTGLNKRVVDARHPAQGLALGLDENRYALFIQPAFWSGLASTPQYQVSLLKHEVLHLLFRHPFINAADQDRLLVDTAMDLVVNQYLRPEELPPDAIRPDQFPELQLLPDQSWHYYYRRLEELQTHQNGRYRSSLALIALRSLQADSTVLQNHQLWKQAYDLPDLEKSIVEGFIDHLTDQAIRKTPPSSISHLPGRLQILFSERLEKPPPLIDWRRAIRIFAAGSARTRIKNTMRRPSKRYGASPGIQVQRLRKLLVAVDTSGSIGTEERRLFFNEIHHLWRQGAEIRIVECDAAIQQTYNYRGQTPALVSGGGDTNFEAPIAYGNQDYLPDGLIYLTDGYGPPPKIRARFPILWVISPKGLEIDSEAFGKLPGRKVKLPG